MPAALAAALCRDLNLFFGYRVATTDERTNLADFYAALRYRPLARKSPFSFARSWFNRDTTTTAANGETLVTKFVIERHQHEAVGVLKGAVAPGSAMPIYRLMVCSGDGVVVTDQNTSPPISTPGYATALS